MASDKPTCIDNQLKSSRIGAFEVQIYVKNEGRTLEKILHSKMKSNVWPNISSILEKIHFFLPRVPKVTVALFKENHPHMSKKDESDSEANFANFKVKMVSNY